MYSSFWLPLLISDEIRQADCLHQLTIQIDFDGLERAARDPQAKMMMICSPHNPAGRVWTREERALDPMLPLLVLASFAFSLLSGLGYCAFLFS